MTPEEFSRTLEKTDIRPAHRRMVDGVEVYIADGWVHPWQYQYLDRFGVTASREEFPAGCFATLYYIHGKVGKGGMELSKHFYQPNRIAAIIAHAREDLSRERKARLNG